MSNTRKIKISIAKQVVRELQLLLDFSALLPDSLALKAQYLNLISDLFDKVFLETVREPLKKRNSRGKRSQGCAGISIW